jgi:hypothetical protein
LEFEMDKNTTFEWFIDDYIKKVVSISY